MKAGKLRHRVSLTRRTPTQDSVNQPSNAFVEFAEVWGSVEPVAGNERFVAERFVAAVDTTIGIRWRSDVLPADRCEVRGRWYEILQVIETELHQKELILGCKLVS